LTGRTGDYNIEAGDFAGGIKLISAGATMIYRSI
jgi:hypothetical protein